MIKNYVILTLMVGVAVNVSPLFAESLFHKTIVLTNHFELIVDEHGNDSLTLMLSQFKQPKKTILVKNAAIKASLIQKAKVCKERNSIFFITAYDRSSTYGAQTNLIVWQSGSTWKIIQAPFTRGFLKKDESLGAHEIVDDYLERKAYCFNDGKFIQQ